MTAAGVLLSFLLKQVCIVSWCTCVSLRVHFPAGREGKNKEGGEGGEEVGGKAEGGRTAEATNKIGSSTQKEI